jgi:hypothetical protein
MSVIIIIIITIIREMILKVALCIIYLPAD